MSWATNFIFVLSILSLAKTNGQKLHKPALLKGFYALDNALKNSLPITNHSHIELWSPGWILEDCKTLTEHENFSSSDIETISVLYNDCSSPWILCRHKDSPDPVWHFVELFGRIPIRARAHIKGMLLLPNNHTNFAYNANNYIVLFNQHNEAHHDWSSLTVMMHEVGHSLDRTAYRDGLLSSSSKWRAAYDQDCSVPDAYAATNFLEDVAQNTVIATYDLNVPGGLGNVKAEWANISHQYELIKKEQAVASTGNLLVPGGECIYRLANSPAVRISGQKKGSRRDARRVKMLDQKPDTGLAEGLEVIVPLEEFSTENSCPRP